MPIQKLSVSACEFSQNFTPTRHCILHLVWTGYFSYHKWYGFSRYSMDFMSFSGILQAKCKRNDIFCFIERRDFLTMHLHAQQQALGDSNPRGIIFIRAVHK